MLLDGLCPSDLSLGNARVTEQNELVLKLSILDRHFYQELDEVEVETITNLYTGEEPLPSFINYLNHLLSSEENKHLGISAFDLMSEIGEIYQSHSGKKFENIAREVLLMLKKHGVNIPLRITLLFKNIQVLNNLAKRAGFDSFLDCLD